MSTSITEAVFLRTRDGRLAAMVDDHCYLAVPAGERWRVAGAWRLSKPAETWEPADFYSWEGFIDGEEGFRAWVEDVAIHRRQLAALSRRRLPMLSALHTPWGVADDSETYGDGVVFHGTPSHGGFKLDEVRNAQVPAALRNADGWYEEDCEWAKVPIAFPALFTDREWRQADNTVRNEWPDYWEQVNGRTIPPGESWAKDHRLFHQAHARDWIALSAAMSKDHSGMVECVAALGGDRGSSKRRCFLVPSDDYVTGRFGFVIDEGRHAEI